MKRLPYIYLSLAVSLVLLTSLGFELALGVFPHRDLSASPVVPQSMRTTLIVTSTADSGPGTLRQALLNAQSGDTINFDASIFPTDQPKVIYLLSVLGIAQGGVTIDASQAGVILDGSKIPDGLSDPIRVTSNDNTISGFQMRNFPGAAIHISGGQNNLIKNNVFGGSDLGIGLWSATTSNNTITGNYVGVLADGVTPLGNRIDGVVVSEGAHDNQIGPDNHIAFNVELGISIKDTNTTGNTITQNSIYDNGNTGIRLFDSNNNLSAPLVFDFDLQAGTMVGITCAHCTVEIFSDSGSEGAIYEGQADADENGVFSYNNNTAFTGPYLTTTATDTNGNTSEFSLHTVGSKGSSTLQEGNNLLRTKIETKPYQELADNHIGHMNPLYGVSCPAEENVRLREVVELGAKWMRLSLDPWELEIAWNMGQYSQFEITECQDETVSLLDEYGTTILYVLVYWDEKLHAEKYPDYKNEEEVQLFLDYTRFIVSHFKGRIQYYEILNEALVYVEVADYVNLIHRVIPIIHEVDPEAKIVVGGATDLRLTYSRDYLFGVLQSDTMPIVEAIAIHPMYGASPQYDELRQYYYNYPSLVEEIKDTAAAHGFRGEYIAEEMNWRTPINPNPYEPWEYTDTVSSKYYARGIVMNLGMDIWAGLTGAEIPYIIRTIQNLSTVMAETKAMDLSIVVQSEYTDIKSYTFSLPNGAHLVTLWTDGVAVDNDPGIPAMLTLSGITEHTVVGIDVVHGFQQQIITSVEEGNLVIRDLLIKDYPIILRVTPIKNLSLPIVLKGSTY